MSRAVFASFVFASVVLLGLVPATGLAQPVRPQPPVQAPNPTVTPSVTVDPDQTSVTPDWSITIPAQYCGGFRIGDGVYVSPEQPIGLPSSFPDGSVLFAGQPASFALINGALRVSPAPGLAQSMICMQGDRALTIELLPQAGMVLPDTSGTYAVDVWTGANPTPMTLQFDVPAASDSQP